MSKELTDASHQLSIHTILDIMHHQDKVCDQEQWRNMEEYTKLLNKILKEYMQQHSVLYNSASHVSTQDEWMRLILPVLKGSVLPVSWIHHCSMLCRKSQFRLWCRHGSVDSSTRDPAMSKGTVYNNHVKLEYYSFYITRWVNLMILLCSNCILMFITSIWCSTIVASVYNQFTSHFDPVKPMQHNVAMYLPTAGSSPDVEPTELNKGLPVSVKDTPKPKDKNVIQLQVCISLPVVISCTHFFHREIWGLTWNGRAFNSRLGKEAEDNFGASLPQSPPKSVVKRFITEETDGLDLSHILLNWPEPLSSSSPWNKAVLMLFATDFIATHQEHPPYLINLEKIFLACSRTQRRKSKPLQKCLKMMMLHCQK